MFPLLSGGAQGRARSAGLGPRCGLPFTFLRCSDESFRWPRGHGHPWAGGTSSSRGRRLRQRAQKAHPGLPGIWSGPRAGLLQLPVWCPRRPQGCAHTPPRHAGSKATGNQKRGRRQGGQEYQICDIFPQGKEAVSRVLINRVLSPFKRNTHGRADLS